MQSEDAMPELCFSKNIKKKPGNSESVINCLKSQQGYCRYLAKQYALSKDAIANGLPLIDTTKSLVEQYCPPFLMTPKCEVQR